MEFSSIVGACKLFVIVVRLIIILNPLRSLRPLRLKTEYKEGGINRRGYGSAQRNMV